MTTVDGNAVMQIERLANGAARAIVLNVSGDAPGVAWIQNPGEKAERVELGAQPRKYSVFSLEALCGMVDHFGQEAPDLNQMIAFVGRGRVSVVLDETEKRLNRLGMDLQISKPFAFLRALDSSPQYYDQKQIVWKLRTEIGADNIEPDDLLARLRSIKFASSSDGTSEVRIGRESMGAQVNRTVMSGGTDFPDECTLTVPVYADLVLKYSRPETQKVVCAIDIDVEKQTFLLKPMPGELDRAQRETDEAIRKYIEETVTATNFKVFNGGL